MNSRLIKQMAKQQFKVNWASFVIVTIIFLICALGLNSINVLTFPIGLLLLIPILLITNAIKMIYIAVIRDYMDHNFFGWTRYILPMIIRNAWQMGVTKVLQAIYLTFWTLLFIIPGIYKALSYVLVDYVLVDFPELSPNEAITMSRRLMRGQKLKYIMLQLRFMWWYLLILLTFGVAYVYVQPYMTVAMVIFYNDSLAKRNVTEEVADVKYGQRRKSKKRQKNKFYKQADDEDEWKNF